MPENSYGRQHASFSKAPTGKTFIFGHRRKDTIPIYITATRPRLGTIGKNHIQSSDVYCISCSFIGSESDTFLKNYINLHADGREGEN